MCYHLPMTNYTNNNILYYLSSSEDNIAFYVGITRRPITRLSQHRRASSKKNYLKYKHIKDIYEKGFTLQMTSIFSNLSLEEAGILEAISIPFFRTLGFDLLNIRVGGILTPQEAFEKRLRVPRSPEVREKIRLGHLGKSRGPQTPEHIESRVKHRRGVKQKQSTVDKRVATRRANDNYVVSDESRRKMSEAHLGQKPTPESIAKRVATVTGQKRTEEQKRRIAEGIRAGKRYKNPLDVAA